MPPASFAPPYNQTFTGKFESAVALAGAHTSMKRLYVSKVSCHSIYSDHFRQTLTSPLTAGLLLRRPR